MIDDGLGANGVRLFHGCCELAFSHRNILYNASCVNVWKYRKLTGLFENQILRKNKQAELSSLCIVYRVSYAQAVEYWMIRYVII